MDTWFWIALATCVMGVIAVAWWRPRSRRGRSGEGMGGNTPSRSASAFPVDPATQRMETVYRQLLARVYALPFPEADPTPRMQGAGHDPVISRSVAQLQEVGKDVRHTPRRPGLLPQLMREVSDPDSSGTRIARIVAQDPVLAASLLRIANSALYRVQARPVESLERAVAAVGTDGIRRLVATVLVQPVMGASGDGVFGRLGALVWEHTGLASAAAAEHARRQPDGQAFVAQLAGLMLGLGAAVVVRTVREQYVRRPSLVPDGGVVAALLGEWAASTAIRISACWELSGQLDPTLEALARGSANGAAVRSLRYGGIVSALALLWRDNALDEPVALAQLAAVEPDAELNEAVWKRLRRSLEDQG